MEEKEHLHGTKTERPASACRSRQRRPVCVKWLIEHKIRQHYM